MMQSMQNGKISRVNVVHTDISNVVANVHEVVVLFETVLIFVIILDMTLSTPHHGGQQRHCGISPRNVCPQALPRFPRNLLQVVEHSLVSQG